ncbi:MAG: hypothetical protein U0326_38240 [Polyangiales bacterium]
MSSVTSRTSTALTSPEVCTTISTTRRAPSFARTTETSYSAGTGSPRRRRA